MDLDTTNHVQVTNNISKLLSNVAVTRKELQSLRKEIRNLAGCYQKDFENILNSIKSWKCESCSLTKNSVNEKKIHSPSDEILLRPIGIVSTSFHKKRGTPRQPGICSTAQGKLTLFNSVFTNPEHALEGLNEFSHMWILFHFHKNDSTHVRAKVAPPRLNGMKTGVFGTRSPHRPSPIGLSLVHIDQIDGINVYFSGVDMLDGTPVLDIKPYIPQYDNPSILSNTQYITKQQSNNTGNNHNEQIDHCRILREAPDGEEANTSDHLSNSMSSIQISDEVRIPRWITEPVTNQLKVGFKEKALFDLEELKQTQSEMNSVKTSDIEDLENLIIRILQEDPRSVYVRERYGNQFYTFLIGKCHVSCKFDDHNHSVQVYKVSRANSLTDSNPLVRNSSTED